NGVHSYRSAGSADDRLSLRLSSIILALSATCSFAALSPTSAVEITVLPTIPAFLNASVVARMLDRSGIDFIVSASLCAALSWYKSGIDFIDSTSLCAALSWYKSDIDLTPLASSCTVLA